MINPDDITTVRVDQLPPDAILLTDIFPFETLADETLKKATFQDLVDFININANALQHEIKSLFVDAEYIANNIDEAGLGINLLVGWRLATELDGLVTIGYGAVQNNIGSYGGEKTHTLIENEVPVHSHTIPTLINRNAASGGSEIVFNASTSATSKSTSSFGGGQSHNNMQPYCVVLKIIKL